ncbi:MAG: selenide, water dikinase SelD [Gammaproteobacteria bacterium]
MTGSSAILLAQSKRKATESDMQQSSTPASKRLVLLGGGHSHLAVLMFFARHPLPGLDITLVSKDIDTPYSGALPAYIAGTATKDDLFIDLRPLAQMAGVRLIQAQVDTLDLDAKCIHCPDRPPVYFDFLSINIGSRPDTSRIPGADDFALAVKPIPLFLEQWQDLQARTKTSGELTLAIVGGGPASVEMACAMQQRLAHSHADAKHHIHIITRAPSVLGGHSKKAQRLANQLLVGKGIRVHTHSQVTRIDKEQVQYRQGDAAQANEITLAVDRCIVATGASPAPWLQRTGLALDDQGFLKVNDHLQSLSHPCVFAAGDIASIAGQVRPKSGVYAVRQGLPLARNLRQFALGAKLGSYQAQHQALALLSMGDGVAIASRGAWAAKGQWAGRWKDWIDQRFVQKYSQLPVMTEPSHQTLNTHAALSEAPHTPIRCAGCAAKLSSGSLGRVIGELKPCSHPSVLSSLQSTEDASIIQIDSQRVLLQSVDYLQGFINDPYVFAKIATNHCLSDIHAMGATAHSALAIVGLPHSAAPIMEDQLRQIMSACTEVLNAHDTALLGGHTSESDTLSFGLSINAFADPATLLRKTGMRVGDVLILTKALGTGVLFAADMRHRARHSWISHALQQMQRSNQSAADIFVAHQANACTDVTGFGLLGHLREMMAEDTCSVSLQLSAIPMLDGASECLNTGLQSSLHQDNARNADMIVNATQFQNEARMQLLFDPQTAGGLLAAVPESLAQACLDALHQGGDTAAVCIGQVQSLGNANPSITLTE